MVTDAPPPDALADTLAASLRTAMIDFVNAAGALRVLPTVFHVGRPGGRSGSDLTAIPDDPALDPGLRADLVERAVDGLSCVDPYGWVTRSGALAPTDADYAWFAATREAFARHGLVLPGFFVICRSGWLNLMTEGVLPQPGVRRRRRRPA